jgi:hypothetical protein
LANQLALLIGDYSFHQLRELFVQEWWDWLPTLAWAALPIE